MDRALLSPLKTGGSLTADCITRTVVVLQWTDLSDYPTLRRGYSIQQEALLVGIVIPWRTLGMSEVKPGAIQPI